MKMHRLIAWIGLMFCAIATGQIPSNSLLRRAPTVVPTDLTKLPRPTLLATPPVRTLVGYTRRVLHLHDGHTLAVFSYSDDNLANWLFLIDSRDLSVQRFDVPNHDVGSHAAALGSDGNIYIMPYGTGRVYKFDVRARKFAEMPHIDLPPGELTWDAIGDPNSTAILFGTYPNACLVRYDIATGKAEVHPHVAPDATYVSNFSIDSAGVHCRAWGPGEHWLTVEPKAFSVHPSTQPTMAPVGFVPPNESFTNPITLAGRHFAISSPLGKLIEFDAARKAIERGDPHAPAEIWFLESVGDDTLIGISHYGAIFRFDLKNNQLVRRDLPNLSPGGNMIMYLAAITPHCVIGGNYSQQNLFRIDPQNGKSQSFNSMIARMPGEGACAIGFGGKGYIGIYIHSLIEEYDPEKPVVFAENPRELSDMSKYEQTRPTDAATDGHHVFITSNSSYSHLGGALAEIDPATGHVDVYPQPIKDQNLPSIAFDPATRTFWLGTDRWGQMHSAPPTQPTAVVFQWDPRQHKVLKTLTPWQQADEIDVIGCSDDGVLMATANGELALIDTSSATVLWHGPSPIGTISKVDRGADGEYYCLGNGALYRWQVSQNRLTPIAMTEGCTFLTPYAPGQWALGNRTSVYRFAPATMATHSP